MAKISGLSALGAAPASNDVFPLVDVSDTTQAASGTTKKVTMTLVSNAVIATAEARANSFTAQQSISTSVAPQLTLIRPGSTARLDFDDGDGNIGSFGYRPGLHVFASVDFAPSVDNAIDLGQASFRWDDIYATNATIQTSDAREKIDIENSDIGWDFIRALRPVKYKWSEKVFTDPETGQQTIKPAGTRTHYGLIAQEVKATMDAQGIDDFSGYIYDELADLHGLRYGELWAPLIAAIKQGADIIEAQAAQIQALSARVAALEGA